VHNRLPERLEPPTNLTDPGEQPLVRLRPGGSRTPVIVTAGILALLAALVWQPWGRPARPLAEVVTASLGPSPSIEALASPAPPAFSVSSPGSSPALSVSSPGAIQAGPAAYLSLVDNEWTIVALLTPNDAGPGEEPALPHPTDPQSGSDPLLVLQQGVNISTSPIERAGKPNLACQEKTVPRDQHAVPLPTGRVLYLGVTFPGMSPQAKVTATDLDRTGSVLSRVHSLVVSLSGQVPDASYSLPSAGPGAAVIFALPRGRVLPDSAYRFEIQAPGTAGPRYVYACVGSGS
jgi:hypothetical protein